MGGTPGVGVLLAGLALRLSVRALWWLLRHWRPVASVVLLFMLAGRVGWTTLAVAGLLLVGVPALARWVWSRYWPVSYERWVAGRVRRWRSRRWVRRSWPALTRECGLSMRRDGRRPGEAVWVSPRLLRVSTRGDCLTLAVRARLGQTVEDLEAATAAIGTAAGAVSWRTRPAGPGVLVIDLVMRDVLTHARLGVVGQVVNVDTVELGRRQDGTAWGLPIRGRHTLVVGCSGAGKGSVLWGIAAGLAPAIAADTARLWGVDLKRGVEIGMGAPLFTTVATTPADAVSVLRRLMGVIDQRGHAMVGRCRLHEPSPGDPLHVLVVDELAALTAYTEPETRREATRLLSEVLTQGRALGVVVVACVQDPRKDTVSMRGLFTQTIALRLRSAEETRMVLGEGTANVAPAHRVSPAFPGAGWVIDDDGTADRVRADHWPDPLVRDVAARYPAPIREQLHPPSTTTSAPQDAPRGNSFGPHDAGPAPTGDSSGPAAPAGEQHAASSRRPRSPRKPRSPRSPRAGGSSSRVSSGAGGWVA